MMGQSFRLQGDLVTVIGVAPEAFAGSFHNDVHGRLIEELTGERYEDVVTKRIFRPLGMDRTFWFAEDVITRS